ncbi:MAG: hypothetical protein ABGZ53_30440 [Fuerstiella sp.]
MSNRSKDNWRGGRKSQQDAAREAAATPSWKRSRHQPSADRRRIRPSRMLIPVTLLLLLVAFGIYIGQQRAPLHTHFMTLTLLGDSGHFDAAAAPEFEIPKSGEYFPVRTTSWQQSATSFDNISNTPGKDLEEAHVVVIYLQTQIVAGAAGAFYCLTQNSSPDLSGPSEYELLSNLEQNLKKFCSHSKAKVILLVDRPTTAQDQRLGDLRADFVTELLHWPNDEELSELVVIVSAAAGQQSAPANGRTAFGQAVMRGFSMSADADGDGELKISEFCQFVEQETDHWVRHHRDSGGQNVQISPQIVQGSDDDFTLMKNVDFEAPSAASSETIDVTIRPLFTQLWHDRDTLDKQLAWRWHPLLWQAATEYLIRGQKALMDGNLPSAKDLADKAENALAELDEFTNEIVTDVAELNPHTGLPRSWFAESPNMSRLNDVWETAEPVGNGDIEDAEDVISENMKVYPFTQLGLPDPDEAELEEVRRNRETAEMAAARVLSVTTSLQKTIATAEERLLNKEDLIFTRRSPTGTGNDVGDESVAARWQAIRRFAEIHQRAELTVQRSLTSVESQVQWAADYPLKADREFFLEWRDLLKENLTTTPDTNGASELLGKARGLANKAGPESNGVAIGLRSNLFGLLVATRTLASQLHPAEPDEGFSVLELEQRSNDLEYWGLKAEKLREDERTKTDELADELSKLPAERVNQVATYGRIRATLGLTNLSPASREQLIGSLVSLDKQLDKDLSDAAEETETSNRRDSLDAALWYVQYLNLFPGSLQGIDGAVAEVDWPAATTDSATSSGSHAEIAAFGASVRDFWKSSRAKVKTSLVPSKSEWETRLRIADLYCRGFSAYDSELNLRQSPTKALHAFWQVSFCLVQTDRLLQSQWVRPNESPPWKENGWYAKCAQIWLKQAEDLAKSLGAGAAGIPDSLRESFDKVGNRLNDSAKWSIKASPSVSSVSIGELDTGSKTVDVKVQMQGQHPPGGVAALRFLAASPGNTAAELVEISNNGSPLSLAKEPQIARIKVQRTGSLDKSECEPVSHVPSVFFRGREWQSTSLLTVDPCPPIEFVVERIARPNTASVTLIGKDIRPIVFILDMSESMNEPLEAPRHPQAIATIDFVINDVVLDKETQASLMVYGHRAKFIKGQGDKPEPNSEYERLFGVEVAGVNPRTDVLTEVRRTKLNPDGKKKFSEMLKKLDRLTPWGITPLVYALKQAISDNEGQDLIIIAVTDGEPSDPELIFQLEDQLRKKPNTKIVIAGFDLNNKANKELADLIAPLQQQGFQIDLESAANKDELLKTILKSLKPREYTIKRRSLKTDIQQKFEQTADGLPPANDYLISFADIAIGPGSPIALGPGDHLSLKVDWNDREFVFHRNKNPRREQATPHPSADEPDTPSMLRSVKEPEKTPSSVDGLNRVQVFLMLDHDLQNRPVRQPAEIEFRLVHRDSYIRLPKIKEEFTSEWNAPGWKLTIDEWPTSDYVRVDAFWKMKRTGAEHVIDYAPIDRKVAEEIGGRNSLPKALLSIKPLDGKLQVRLDRIPDVSYDNKENLVEDIRIEIGTRDLSEDNDSFRPFEVTTTIRRTDKGSVIYEFDGTYTEEKLRKIDIAFTSRSARFADALRLKEPLVTSE